MRAATSSILAAAQDGGYAVPAFNIFDELTLRSVIRAAELAESQVIIQVSTRTAKAMGVRWAVELFRDATIDSLVPASLHLDHCPDRQVIAQAVEGGWCSLLFDASHLDFDDAVEQTAEVVRLAHAKGVEVESEIENIVGVEDGIGSETAIHAYSAEAVAAAARRTGADFLAPQLGTSHGQYISRPHLLPQRAVEFRRLCGLPLVLHGGSGLTPQEFQQFVQAGVSKINISTAIKRSYMQTARAFLEDSAKKNDWEPGPLMQALGQAVCDTAVEYFGVFGSAGKAKL